MKDFRKAAFVIPCLLITAILTACGGGGGGGAILSALTGSSGLGGTGISQGVITAFGSVFVNGIEFSTGGATVKIDDNPGLESDLKIGMVVTVRGTADDAARTGSAV
ncbi:MAG: hypothetical protein HY661_17065, partial [Betaproteobacteria bacterium]|nr:hypothetical protein [Betaproteobacteria bacterium]